MLISSNIGRKDKGNFDFYITRSGFCGGFATLTAKHTANRLWAMVGLSLLVVPAKANFNPAGEAAWQ